MKSVVLLLMLLLYFPLPLIGQRLAPPRKYHSNDDDEFAVDYDDDEDDTDTNNTAGSYLGAPCVDSCNPKLHHVYCNPVRKLCECEKNYPVKIGSTRGCSKPKQLGEQCYFRESCMYTDAHSSCIQIHHNAICQCVSGYHSVNIQKPNRKTFCAEDLVVMTTDLSTLAGVISGIAVLSGLICFVLRLFNQNLYSGRHRYGNANLPPPILFSSDAGPLPLPLTDRSSTSRASSSHRTYASMQSRRASSAAAAAATYRVSTSRAGAARAAAILLLSCRQQVVPCEPVTRVVYTIGSRRPSLASAHSNTSIRSYSMRRFEQEREQKEERERQKRMTARMNSSTNSLARLPPTPSPHSTDDLLPTLEEGKQVPPLAVKEESSSSFQEEMPSTSKQYS